MYYLVFGLLYLFSLLPFWVLYRVSDFAVFILYNVVGYRKQIVLDNIRHAFPGKTEAELKQLRRRFYRNFCDNWIELVKFMSLSKNGLDNRTKVDFTLLHDLYKTGKAVQIFSGHFMNWEYANYVLSAYSPFPLLCVYMPIENKIFERLLKYIRARFGSHLLKATGLRREMDPWMNKQYLIGLVADQSPGNSMDAYWMYFMNRPAGFVRGPWRQAVRLDQPLVYTSIKRPRRGYYEFKAVALELEPKGKQPGDLAYSYKNLLESDVAETPANYLWSHRRWKKPYQNDFAKLWVDPKPAPRME